MIRTERTVSVTTVPLTTQDYREGITTCPLSTLLLEERQHTRDDSTQLKKVTQNLRRDIQHSSNSEIYGTRCAVQSDGSVYRQDLSRKVSVLHRWFLLRFIKGSPNRLCHCKWIQSWDNVKKKMAHKIMTNHTSHNCRNTTVLPEMCATASHARRQSGDHTRGSYDPAVVLYLVRS